MYYDDFDLTDLMVRRTLIDQAISTIGHEDKDFTFDEDKLILEYLNYDREQIVKAIRARVEQLREGQEQ